MNWNNINTDRDTSGLGPIEYDQSKVPTLIRKHADNVRTKTYGQEVREAQARNAELAGLIASESVDISNETRDRQGTVESQFNAVQQELTDKDPISAPEIIVARDGEETLNDRLLKDKDHVYIYPSDDDTYTINKAFENYQHVILTSGDYEIDATQSVVVPSDKTLTFAKGARMLAEANESRLSSLINLFNVSDIVINNPNIVGDRESHYFGDKVWQQWKPSTNYNLDDIVYLNHLGFKATQSGTSGTSAPNEMKEVTYSEITDGSVKWSLISENVGEQGHGINIQNAQNVTINYPNVSDCWGDGIYIGVYYGNQNAMQNKNITINYPEVENVRRNGIAVCSGENITIVNPKVKNISGTLPEAGIDIEPEGEDLPPILENIRIVNPITKNCNGGGIIVQLFHLLNRDISTNVSITNHVDDGSYAGSSLFGEQGTLSGSIIYENPTWKNNKVQGLLVKEWDLNSAKIIVNNPHVINPGLANSTNPKYSSAIALIRDAGRTTHTMGGLSIQNPKVTTTQSIKPKHAFVFLDETLGNSVESIKDISISNPIEMNYQTSPILAPSTRVKLIGFDKITPRDIGSGGTINTYNYHRTYEVSNWNGVYISNDFPIGTEIELISKSVTGFKINVDPQMIVYPLPKTTGIGLQTYEYGNRITLFKRTSTEWITSNIVGQFETL